MSLARHHVFLLAASCLALLSPGTARAAGTCNCCRKMSDAFDPSTCKDDQPTSDCGRGAATADCSNGCGPDGWKGAVVRALNQSTGANFTPACNAHDNCYNTCGSSRADCDGALASKMNQACDQAWANSDVPGAYTWCLVVAEQERIVISLSGGAAWDADQRIYCCCADAATAGLGGCMTVAPVVSAAALPAAATCEPTWVGTATYVVTGNFSTQAAVTWAPDTAQSNYPQMVYVAEGTVDVTSTLYNGLGCTISPTHFTVGPGQDPLGDNHLSIDFRPSPAVYIGSGTMGREITVTCPDSQPFTLTTAFVWFSASGSVSADGQTIAGSTATYTFSFQAQ